MQILFVFRESSELPDDVLVLWAHFSFSFFQVAPQGAVCFPCFQPLSVTFIQTTQANKESVGEKKFSGQAFMFFGVGSLYLLRIFTIRCAKCIAPQETPPPCRRALKKSLFSKMHYHNASKDASICSKCNAFVHYLTYYKRFYLRFVGSSFKYRTFSVPSLAGRGFPCTRVTFPLFPTRLCCPRMRPWLFK